MNETINIKQFYSYAYLKLETKFINNYHDFKNWVPDTTITVTHTLHNYYLFVRARTRVRDVSHSSAVSDGEAP